jgi:disulfide bond formation protein DsbB
MNRSIGVTLNALGLYGIALVLIAAFAGQILLGELPCPLCLLQRVLFLGPTEYKVVARLIRAQKRAPL